MFILHLIQFFFFIIFRYSFPIYVLWFHVRFLVVHWFQDIYMVCYDLLHESHFFAIREKKENLHYCGLSCPGWPENKIESEKKDIYLDVARELMVCWLVVRYINLCRLFNAKSIFIQIVLFQTIQFRISTQFKCK